ncbi:MAG: alpha/beta hydrolase fold protein [Bacteroidetes bacterium]|nr:alpha/beta hydrolase fold protein [Bacteroidota bacterium]
MRVRLQVEATRRNKDRTSTQNVQPITNLGAPMKNLLRVFLAAAMVAITVTSCDILEPEDPGLLVPLTVDEDPSLPSIAVNGTQLHSETFGNPDDPLLVVLHGGPGGDYRSLLNCNKFSADGFFVVFYDQRGSGLSRRHNREIYTTQLFIDDLDAVIKYYRRRADQKVVLLGQSWGAMLATAYVNEHPDVVSGVVMIEPGGFTWPDAEAYVERCRSPKVFDETSNDYLYLDQIITGSDHIKLDYKAALQGAADYSDGNKVGNPGPYPFWRKGAVCGFAATDYARDHSFDFTTRLRQFTTKVLFTYSELNEAYGRAHAQHVSSAYPNVQLVEIKGTGHEIPYFGWDGFYPVASAYLNTIK